MNDLTKDIERLIAIEEIKRLKARYFYGIDNKDWDLWAREVWAPDARLIVSASDDQMVRAWYLDWALIGRDAADWDNGARPCVEAWLACRTRSTNILKTGKITNSTTGQNDGWRYCSSPGQPAQPVTHPSTKKASHPLGWGPGGPRQAPDPVPGEWIPPCGKPCPSSPSPWPSCSRAPAMEFFSGWRRICPARSASKASNQVHPNISPYKTFHQTRSQCNCRIKSFADWS